MQPPRYFDFYGKQRILIAVDHVAHSDMLQINILHLSVTTRAVIGQFNVAVFYCTARLNLKLFLLSKCFVVYGKVFLTFIAS